MVANREDQIKALTDNIDDDVLFGEVWSREGQLPLKTRSIVTITALISKGITDSSLNCHLMTAKKNGVSKCGGQVLIGVEGEGWCQIEGQDPIKILPGTIVEVPAGAKHWHGASKNSWFSHLAFMIPGEDLSNEWLEAVDEDFYNTLD